jgi:predicted dehydrogenase
MKKLRAAIIGLGKAGSRFDEEPRGAIWSHAGAYLAHPDIYDLVAGVDVSVENRIRFSYRCPSIKIFSSPSDLVGLNIDIVSICTPPFVRLQVFKEILYSSPQLKVIVCEKPLATDAATRSKLVAMCEEANVILLVHYNRRYAEIYRRFSSAIGDGMIGTVNSITIRAPNRLWSIGSHALDLLFYLSNDKPEYWKVLPLPALTERGEPAGDFICTFRSGSAGRVLTQGPSNILIFEVDAVGSKGRLMARENGKFLELTMHVSSSRYLGYLESGESCLLYESTASESGFIAIILEAASLAHGHGVPTCSGKMAQLSEEFLDQIVKNVEEFGS